MPFLAQAIPAFIQRKFSIFPSGGNQKISGPLCQLQARITRTIPGSHETPARDDRGPAITHQTSTIYYGCGRQGGSP